MGNLKEGGGWFRSSRALCGVDGLLAIVSQTHQ